MAAALDIPRTKHRRHFLSIILVVCLSGCLAPEDTPWTELSLEHPIGFATSMKLRTMVEDQQACSAALETALSLETRPAASDAGTSACPLSNAVAFERSTVSYGGEFVASCSLAAALYIWEREVLAPSASEHLGVAVTRIDQIGTFVCRNVYNREAGRISEHASANALDIAGFRLADGRRVSVLDDWGKPTPEGRFLTALRDASCEVFSGVLTPDYNEAHRDHFHLDMGPYRICS